MLELVAPVRGDAHARLRREAGVGGAQRARYEGRLGWRLERRYIARPPIPHEIRLVVTENSGLVFVLLPGGTYLAGSQPDVAEWCGEVSSLRLA